MDLKKNKISGNKTGALDIATSISPEQTVTRHDIKNILLIVSGSRSGSSLLYWLLSQSHKCFMLGGEETPFYRRNGLYDENNLSERFSVSTQMLDNCGGDILANAGFYENDLIRLNEDKLDRYVKTLFFRFRMLKSIPVRY